MSSVPPRGKSATLATSYYIYIREGGHPRAAGVRKKEKRTDRVRGCPVFSPPIEHANAIIYYLVVGSLSFVIVATLVLQLFSIVWRDDGNSFSLFLSSAACAVSKTHSLSFSLCACVCICICVHDQRNRCQSVSRLTDKSTGDDERRGIREISRIINESITAGCRRLLRAWFSPQ
jgi:hypothetical protein